MFDTHCHLNFKAFEKNLPEIIERAKNSGIKFLIIPATDEKTTKKGQKISHEYKNTFFSVGIHPHHIYNFVDENVNTLERHIIRLISNFIDDKKCVAIGETGIDRFLYKKTKYKTYSLNEKFLELQKKAFLIQLLKAKETNKALIIHNREATEDLLKILQENWDDNLRENCVFHCCEANNSLIEFAKEKRIFIGVDGDLTYNIEKQIFFKKIPLDLLVLETDSPFLTPEPIKKKKRFPNEPANLVYILELASYLRKISEDKLAEITLENGRRLFKI